MRFSGKIYPRSILAVSAAVTLLMVGSALVELRQSRDELFHVMQENAYSVAEAIERSAANNLLSSAEAEDLLAERLFDNATLLSRLDSLAPLSALDLQRFADLNNLFSISILDARGRRIVANSSADSSTAEPGQVGEVPGIEPILRRESDRLLIGFIEHAGRHRYGVAVRRARQGGGAIVVDLNADQLLEYRRSVGIGKLISDLGNNGGLAYIALQDTQGIISATGAVSELSSIAADPFLQAALGYDSVVTRVVQFKGTDTYEVVYPFVFEENVIGLFRVGLHMHEIRAAEERMQRRIIVISLVVILIAVLAITVIMASQSAKSAQERYVRVSAFSSNILQGMQDAVVSTDAAGAITVFNHQAERIFGIPEKDALGLPVESLKSEAGRCLQEIFAAAQGSNEVTLDCPEGVQRTVSVALSITSGPTGLVESKTAVVRDLTEARRLQREVQRKERLSAMGELASGVAHEIRNPMNAIAMIAQRFEHEFTPRKGSKEYRSLTAVLRAEVQRVNQIVRQFLQFARPAGLSLQDVKIRDFEANVALLFEGQARAKGVGFHHRFEGDAGTSIDPAQITQALLNVLQNALDATSPGGRIEFTGCVDAEQVVFTVRDTGIGIPQEKLGKIFDLYYTSKPEGTGMGLAITQQIVTRHDGNIEVTSKEGEGTSVSISLPRRSALQTAQLPA